MSPSNSRARPDAAGRELLPVGRGAALAVLVVWITAAGADPALAEPELAPVPFPGSHPDIELPGNEVIVPFVTNRDADLGGGRGLLRSGRCTVRLPPERSRRTLSGVLPIRVRSENERVVAITPSPPGAFWQRLTAGAGDGSKILLTIHGYKMTFERACKRAARLARNLDAVGRLVLFSWPADRNTLAYGRDEADMAWSMSDLELVLTGLVERLGRGRLQVIAHSLGSRGIVDTIYTMAGAHQGEPLLDQLVLVAPDVDAGTFARRAARLRPLASHITIYASSADGALKISREFHGHPRLGEAGADLTVIAGIDSIDVSPARREEVSGHHYHLYNPPVIADLRELLTTGAKAADRPGLEPVGSSDHRHFAIRPTVEAGASP